MFFFVVVVVPTNHLTEPHRRFKMVEKIRSLNRSHCMQPFDAEVAGCHRSPNNAAFNLPQKWEVGISEFMTSVHSSYKVCVCVCVRGGEDDDDDDLLLAKGKSLLLASWSANVSDKSDVYYSMKSSCHIYLLKTVNCIVKVIHLTS